MYKALHLSPMVPSCNLKETVLFFVSILDFKIILEHDGYSIVEKDGLTIHILRAGDDIGEMEFYLEVDNVDVLWNNIKNKVNGLKFKEPFNRDYSMREVHIIVPQTKALLFIGSQI